MTVCVHGVTLAYSAHPVRADVELVELGRIPHLGRLERMGPRDREAVERALQLADLAELAQRRWSPFSPVSARPLRRRK